MTQASESSLQAEMMSWNVLAPNAPIQLYKSRKRKMGLAAANLEAPLNFPFSPQPFAKWGCGHFHDIFPTFALLSILTDSALV